MTLAELRELVFKKTYDDNPLRPSDELRAEPDSEEFLEQYQAQHDYYMLCMDAIEEVYRTLQEELQLTGGGIQKLSPDTPLPSRTNELAEKLRNFPPEFREEPQAERIKRAFDLFGILDFYSLAFAYTVEDQKLMKTDAWDDENPILITNRVRHILEGIDPMALDEKDRVWWREIMWFWYHHAISCAIWKRKDRALAQRYADKAREIQGDLGHPNRITEVLRLLVHDKVGDARKMVDQLITEANSAKELLEEYERGEFFK
jgi:hypothetical protein